jgi:hypothetical protein
MGRPPIAADDVSIAVCVVLPSRQCHAFYARASSAGVRVPEVIGVRRRCGSFPDRRRSRW